MHGAQRGSLDIAFNGGLNFTSLNVSSEFRCGSCEHHWNSMIAPGKLPIPESVDRRRVGYVATGAGMEASSVRDYGT